MGEKRGAQPKEVEGKQNWTRKGGEVYSKESEEEWKGAEGRMVTEKQLVKGGRTGELQTCIKISKEWERQGGKGPPWRTEGILAAVCHPLSIEDL